MRPDPVRARPFWGQSKAALAATLLLASTCLGGSAEARPKKHDGKQGPDLQAIGAQIAGHEPGPMAVGLRSVASGGAETRPLLPLVERELRRGLPAVLAREAFAAVAAAGQPSSTSALRPYLRHRNESVRAEAAFAVAKTGGPQAAPALLEALSDVSLRVRAAAARGLGDLGAHESMTELWAAFDRGLDDAAWALGRLCIGPECSALVSKLKGPGATAGAAVAAATALAPRAGEAVAVSDAVEVVERASTLGHGSAATALGELLSRLPPGAPPDLRAALERAAARGGS